MVKIFLDFEMNPIPKEFVVQREICRNEVIQIGAVALNAEDHLIGDYEKIVRPKFSTTVAPVIYHLTGITTEMLEQGISFEEAMLDFAGWCDKISNNTAYEIYAWSNSDLIQLQQEMLIKECTDFFDMQFMNVWIDFQYEFSTLIGISASMSLDKAISALDINFSGSQHNALNDALNTAKLYQMTQNKEELARVLKPMQEMMEPSKKLSTQMGSVFNLDLFNFDNE